MFFFFDRKCINIVGMKEDVYQMSRKERLPRKKYMGVWRRESRRVRVTKVLFPRRITKYIIKHITKRSFSALGYSESPRRMNSISVQLVLSISLFYTWSIPEEKELHVNLTNLYNVNRVRDHCRRGNKFVSPSWNDDNSCEFSFLNSSSRS